MDLTDANLMQLVAELRKRLRPFAVRPPGAVANQRDPGALSAVERVALAARLLALALEARSGDDAQEAAGALRSLSEGLSSLPPGATGGLAPNALDALMQDLENLACAWDQHAAVDFPELWRRVRMAGDHLWPAELPDRRPQVEALEPGATELTRQEIWLMVSGKLRRTTLARRLEQAGLTVVCLENAEELVARLAGRHPDAVVSDDAAPVRHHRRLQAMMPPESPPLVLVQGRQGRRDRTILGWNPPHRAADLVALLQR